jgi:hypothetical protein
MSEATFGVARRPGVVRAVVAAFALPDGQEVHQSG